mmetsp:Transcript_19951/g.22944  ORF Transcript_19951/g.22944 Transcript_19951/m.22944 type:complete len:301 (-) Transcript_19951:99-1001(-)|eukprot:CAMPEP_0176434748 /NCGR_PEP_ID=MMETSP0127-20121128/16873_1 /TAXON_ID=938130 /ORGANISM="Platyophrya macrostoma, Strain WH" /LENGTH=300 /DNA_ID=CAMNT_0017817567 /DNA_START=158 /DNA_END=1060 /DNA_ORIENTATION=+
MTSLFQTYDEELRDVVKEFGDLLNEVRQTLQRETPSYRAPPPTGPSSRLQKCKTLTELLQKARELSLWMERECASADFPISQRETSRQKVAEYRKQSLQFERDLKRVKDDCGAADRADLLGASGSPNSTNGGAMTAEQRAAMTGLDEETRKQREQMARNTETLKTGSKFLREAEKLTNETEEMSGTALKTLVGQTTTISGIISKTHEADDEVSQARKILNDMHKEMIKNKAILLIIILVLLLLIFLVLYIKFGGSSSSSSSSSTTTVIYVTSSPSSPTVAPPPSTSTISNSTSSGSGSAF